MIYKYNYHVGNIVMLAITTFALWLTCYMVEKDGLRAGVFAVENYHLLDDLFAPPQGHLVCTTTGVAMSYIYYSILLYRKGGESRMMAYLHNNSWPSYVMIYLGVATVLFNLTIGHPAIADPYSWSTL